MPAVIVMLGLQPLHHRTFLRRGFRLKIEARDRTMARTGPTAAINHCQPEAADINNRIKKERPKGRP